MKLNSWNRLNELVGLLVRYGLVQVVVGQDARSVLARPQAFGEFERDSAVGGGFPRLDVQRMAQVIEQVVSSAKGTAYRAADPQAASAGRVVLLEVAVEREHVLHLGRRQIEQVSDLDDSLQGDI